MVNSSGPKQDPCGTPWDNSVLWEYAPSTITCCKRSDRYDLNHISAESVTPNDVSSLCSKILWSTVSNAALKSSRTNNVVCLRFMLWKMSFTTFISAVSVLCCFLYVECSMRYKSFSDRWLCNWSKIGKSTRKNQLGRMGYRLLCFKFCSVSIQILKNVWNLFF